MESPENWKPHIEEEYYNFVSSTDNILDINLPRSNGFVYNSRHQKLHFRLFYDHNQPIKALIVYLHGYSAHINKPNYRYMAEQAVLHQTAVVFLDFHG